MGTLGLWPTLGVFPPVLWRKDIVAQGIGPRQAVINRHRMKVIEYPLLNTGPTPQDVKEYRLHVYEAQSKLGTPVIFKHRWNMVDVTNGLAQLCPLYDDSYHRSKTDCPYCFGTGFLGGFSDGIIQFVTIADTPVDQLKIDAQGYILFDKHPELTAPWFPDMGDGDLIIMAEFDFSNWDVLTTLDRFELNEVKPTTIRGPFSEYTAYQFFKIQQNAKMDRVPNGHVYYNVPIEFDYNSAPIVFPPPGSDPDDFPYPDFIQTYGLRLIGSESQLTATTSSNLKLIGSGTNATVTHGLSIEGSSDGTTVIFE